MTNPLSFNRDHDVDYGVCEQLSPLIRRITANNPSPFTFKGTGTYIIGQGDGVAVIDPGPDDDAHFEALMTELKGERVSHIMVTHSHHDHVELVPEFKAATNAPVYAYGAHEDSGIISDSGSAELDAGTDKNFKPDIEIAHGDIISGTDWSLEAVFTPGHMANHMCFALPQEKTLFSGDHVMAWSTSVIAPPDGNMAQYMASLEILLGRDDDIYRPTHGGPVLNPKPFVRAFITHRKIRERAIFNRLKAGDKTIEDIVPKIYKTLDPKLYPAASLSVLAHLEHLLEMGRIETEDEFGLKASFHAVGNL